ncbi:phage baseplate plug family protein [Paraburkholderia sp. MM6662-R1]|uniref:phage baseplate plug family protein n=1 Tax=Paraburkholderia sp. MM6662-R1 TaxID=2991066 RepID=UPI003D2527B3
MQTIPLTAKPSQTLTLTLALQNCGLKVYQKNTGLYLDLYVAGRLVMAAVLCRDRVFLVRQAYLGFQGDLVFVDLQGTDDPEYTGLGSRWELRYVEEAS